VSTVHVDSSGACASVSVDIALTHDNVGDLSVTLISPRNTLVSLHNRSGSDGDDLVGNWPVTLAVDGPVTLDALLGEEVHGDWVLMVFDQVAGHTGVLQSWGLNLVIPASLSVDDGEEETPPPAATALLGNAPNPFNAGTRILFDLARDDRVRLDLFDVRGRLVRRLLDAPLAAGRHEVAWDSRDDAGRPVASGTYLCRLRGDGLERFRTLSAVR
jgi:subtilisin-like proprotein convertase family protein